MATSGQLSLLEEIRAYWGRVTQESGDSEVSNLALSARLGAAAGLRPATDESSEAHTGAPPAA